MNADYIANCRHSALSTGVLYGYQIWEAYTPIICERTLYMFSPTSNSVISIFPCKFGRVTMHVRIKIGMDLSESGYSHQYPSQQPSELECRWHLAQTAICTNQ